MRFLALALSLTLAACQPKPEASLNPGQILGETPQTGFARAVEVRPFSFPRDHGAHREFRTEWWYATGNLSDGERDFGYQLTLFRFALKPPNGATSGWQADQLYMGHLALSDIDGERFFAAERLSRAALGLAGASDQQLHVWVEDWAMSGAQSLWPIMLDAEDQRFGLKLELTAGKQPVLQGQQGLSRKSERPGNASYYYSLPRIETQGQVRIDGQIFTVSGSSWIDREWSTSALDAGQVGWDWFALQLDGGHELMLYRLREQDNGTHPYSAGLWIDADGSHQPLQAGQFALQVESYWRSPASGRRYPARWTISVPELALKLGLSPRLADQELRLMFTYWEGSVVAEGQYGDQPIDGLGYLEMTGY